MGGSFVVGNTYEIVTVGSTNFTLIGAAANTVGVIFTATGVGSGSGTARLVAEYAFATTNGSSIVTTYFDNHGFNVGDFSMSAFQPQLAVFLFLACTRSKAL